MIGRVTHREAAKVTRCLGAVRWVPLSMLQAHRRKLQQLYEIICYENGKPVSHETEWRDVPLEDEELNARKSERAIVRPDCAQKSSGASHDR